MSPNRDLQQSQGERMISYSKKCVVVPVDLSEESFAAVDVGLEITDQPSHLHVIHVLRDVTAAEFEHLWNKADQDRWHSKAKKKIEERLAAEKYDGIQVEVAFGSPGESITDYARRVSAELIVMPSHGRRGLSHWLLGSVAERVLRLSPCPVLVLKS